MIFKKLPDLEIKADGKNNSEGKNKKIKIICCLYYFIETTL